MIHELHNAIRQFVERESKKSLISKNIMLYQINEDEVNDSTLVSQRVYQTREYSDIIRLCCGVSYPHEPLPLGLVFLPSLAQLVQLRKKYM